jgi:hypothetical protein
MAEKSRTERAERSFRALLVVECRMELSHLAYLGASPAGEILGAAHGDELGAPVQSQGKRQEAYELLALVYDWFTEGFDAPDLKDAKALLDELA